MAAFNENFLTGNDFEAVLVFFCCYGSGGNPSEVVQQITTDETMVPDLLFIESWFCAQSYNISNSTNTPSALLKNCRRHYRKRSNNQSIMKFIHSGNEIKFYKVFSGNKLDGVICFKFLISFDDDTEDTLLSILMYLQIASRYIYTRYQTLKLLFWLWSHRQMKF